MKSVRLALYCAVVGVAVVTAPAPAEDPRPPKNNHHIPTLMREAHMRGRQVYRSLDMLLISGRSRSEEREHYRKILAQLRELTPPQGTVESWRHDIDRINGIVWEMDEAKDDEGMVKAGSVLWRATNCMACHEKYKYAPNPDAGQAVPKSLAIGRKAVEVGGKDWSAPQSLNELGYTQPGRRMLVWPTKIEYHPTDNREKPFLASVQFHWRFNPGAELSDNVLSSSGQFYYHHYASTESGKWDPKNLNFQFAGRLASGQREGTFDVGFDVPKGGSDVAFVLLANWTEPVPLGNLLVRKLRPGK